jgi:translation initiation factor 1
MNLKIKEGRNPKTGKPITIISDIKHNPQVIEKLASNLKSKCGTGGHIDGKKIILNGSQIDKAISILEKEGFTITRS